jgi:hypothetical protein
VETSSTEAFDPVRAKANFEAHMQGKAVGEQPAEVADGKDTEQPTAEVAEKSTEHPDAREPWGKEAALQAKEMYEETQKRHRAMYMRMAFEQMNLAKLQEAARNWGKLTEAAKGMNREELTEYLICPEGK